MALYIFLGKRTREGDMTVKDGPQRAAASAEYTKELGLKVIDYYATLGPYDYVSIIEGPDDPSTYFKLVTFAAMDGNITWTTLPALRGQDFIQLVQELPGRAGTRSR